MEMFAALLRYSFVAVLAIEAVLIGRALVMMAIEKARTVTPAPPAEE